ncbi:MAG: hypothetical protein V4772_07710, partial [Pseudomonadota bacterium]
DEALVYAERLKLAGLQAHVAVLPGPTGWPASYLQTGSHEAAWAPAVRQQFSDFFRCFKGDAMAGEAAQRLFSTTPTPAPTPGPVAAPKLISVSSFFNQ